MSTSETSGVLDPHAALAGAQHTVTLLRAALASRGLDPDREFQHLAVRLTASGQPIVNTGVLRPLTALRLAVALSDAPDPGPCAEFDAAPDPMSVGVLRRAIRTTLQQWDAAHLAERVEQVASELLTNALLYGDLDGGRLRALLTLADKSVVLAVPDNNARPPSLLRADDDALGGRGMTIVGLLADGWGVRCTPQGKTVSAEFALYAS